MLPSDYWRGAVAKYKTKDWAVKPSLFALDLSEILPRKGALLELGSGAGNDGLYFRSMGYDVLQADLEDFRSEQAKKIEFKVMDMSEPLRLKGAFDVVYAHLSLHYFSEKRTKELFKELHSLLNAGGVFAFLVNSVYDPEFRTGKKLEDHFFEVNGINKRYFDKIEVQKFTKDLFEPLLADECGTSYKDKADGMTQLVRFAGTKK
ncbi:MAG: class I SAM-dependent methyltransferase [Candidatus Saccharimonadales bacterium]